MRRAMVGSRIRDKRLASGLRQADLAKRVGISASYLNLIEHNRRRIGGSTLLKLATVLGVSPTYLSDGADSTLIAGLAEIAALPEFQETRADQAEELAGQFPDWAAGLVDLYRRIQQMERRISDLSDRLASDPQLAEALHDMISAVTSIRSTASILAGSPELEPAWQYRFHRNIDEDSRRLAERSQALVRYLETEDDQGTRTPQDEAYAFFRQHNFHFPGLEDGAMSPEALIDAAPLSLSAQGRALVRPMLARIYNDAQALPLPEIADAVRRVGPDPRALTREMDQPLPLLFRRLALLDPALTGPVGLVICDGAGALIFRKPIAGFVIPRGSSACPLWPLYQGLSAPQVPLRLRLSQAGRQETNVIALTATETVSPHRYDMPGLTYAHMLLLPDQPESAGQATRQVGADCRICPVRGCAGRREPSVLA